MAKRPDRPGRKHREPYSKKIGRPPGSIDHVGEIKVAKPAITLFDYNDADLIEVRFSTIEDSRNYKRQHERLWLNVHGLHEARVMEEIGRRFHLHPLVLEDVANTQQRPKLDDYGDYVFVLLRAFTYSAEAHDACSDQIALVLGQNFVLSFQERPTGLFDPIRDRLRKAGSTLRRAGPDALLHALIDAVVDRYFLVVEGLANDVETLEDAIMTGTHGRIIESINHFKRETLEIRRSIWPTREVLNSIQRYQGSFLSKETQLYFRDVYDHTVHVIDQTDALREQIGDLLDIHLSTVSNRLNAEVRILTIVTTLLAPATIVTGFFGMNFEHMPLLASPEGWEVSLMLIGGAAATLVGALYLQRWWIRRKG